MRWDKPLFALIFAAALVFPGISAASTLNHERQIDALASSVMALAASNRNEAALDLLARHGSGQDSALQTSLDQARSQTEAVHTRLGDITSAALLDATYFAGCHTHRFVVRRENGTHNWQMKFRRTVNGWQVKDVLVRQ